MKTKTKLIGGIVTVLLVGLFIFLGKDLLKEPVIKDDSKKEEIKKEEPPKPKLKILDLESNTRSIGVMIDNVDGAWPQAGLEEAYLVYDITVEYGLTRLFAIFKDSNANLIGPVRSSRHYFLDYAMENDAIYAHHGWSPQAQRDIGKFGINNVVPVNRKGTWGHIAPHNVFTSIEEINKLGNKYRKTTEKKPVLNYSVEEVNINNEDSTNFAKNVVIRYSNNYTVKYVYNEETKLYERFINGRKHTDLESKNQLTAKNIIILNVKNYPDPNNSDKGRITLDNVGTGKGYYITNGYFKPITWSKSSRDAKTVYKYEDETEITVNDGNTYIQIQPINETVKFE